MLLFTFITFGGQHVNLVLWLWDVPHCTKFGGDLKSRKGETYSLNPTLAARVRTQDRGLSLHTLLPTVDYGMCYTDKSRENNCSEEHQQQPIYRSHRTACRQEQLVYSGRDNRTSHATSKAIWVESWLCCSFWFFSDFLTLLL